MAWLIDTWSYCFIDIGIRIQAVKRYVPMKEGRKGCLGIDKILLPGDFESLYTKYQWYLDTPAEKRSRMIGINNSEK